MLTKKPFRLHENMSLANDILESTLRSVEFYDINDEASQIIIDKLFQAIELESDNIATTGYRMRNEMNLGACLNILLYCLNTWYTEGGQYTFFYVSQVWMRKRMVEITGSDDNKFIQLIDLLTYLSKISPSYSDKELLRKLQQSLCIYAKSLENEEKLEEAAEFFLHATQFVEYCSYQEIVSLKNSLEDIASLLDDERLDNVANLLGRLQVIAQPDVENDAMCGVIADLKEDFINHKEVFSRQVDQAVLFAMYEQLKTRKEHQKHYEEFKEALSLSH